MPKPPPRLEARNRSSTTKTSAAAFLPHGAAAVTTALPGPKPVDDASRRDLHDAGGIAASTRDRRRGRAACRPRPAAGREASRARPARSRPAGGPGPGCRGSPGRSTRPGRSRGARAVRVVVPSARPGSSPLRGIVADDRGITHLPDDPRLGNRGGVGGLGDGGDPAGVPRIGSWIAPPAGRGVTTSVLGSRWTSAAVLRSCPKPIATISAFPGAIAFTIPVGPTRRTVESVDCHWIPLRIARLPCPGTSTRRVSDSSGPRTTRPSRQRDLAAAHFHRRGRHDGRRSAGRLDDGAPRARPPITSPMESTAATSGPQRFPAHPPRQDRGAVLPHAPGARPAGSRPGAASRRRARG